MGRGGGVGRKRQIGWKAGHRQVGTMTGCYSMSSHQMQDTKGSMGLGK